MFYLFVLNEFDKYISIEGDDSYIAYCMILKYYSKVENINYIGAFEHFNDVSVNTPGNYVSNIVSNIDLDIYDYDEFYNYKKVYFEKIQATK